MKPDFLIISLLYCLNWMTDCHIQWTSVLMGSMTNVILSMRSPLIGHYLKKEDVYYTSVKTVIVMLEANGILLRLIMTIMQCSPRKGKRYIEINERSLWIDGKNCMKGKKMKDRWKMRILLISLFDIHVLG